MTIDAARSGLPSHAGQVTFTSGDAAASVHLIAISAEKCQLPHAGLAIAGQSLVIEFLDGVRLPGRVTAIEDETMEVTFDRSASTALVEYFAPVTVQDMRDDKDDPAGICDAFGRRLPPLSRNFSD